MAACAKAEIKVGGIRASVDLLTAVRDLTREKGILLIFDEIITGFRLGLGGAGTYFGVEPDLVAMGKIIRGGLPLGAYGGQAEIMERVVTPHARPSYATGKIFHPPYLVSSCQEGWPTAFGEDQSPQRGH